MSTATVPLPAAAPAPEFLPVARRLFWKELRRMRGFALGVGVLTLGAMLFACQIALPGDEPELRAVLVFLAFFFAAFLAIGAAVTAFAVEREERTDTFLSQLPRYWQATLAGKLTATLTMAVTFAAVMSLVAWAVAGWAWPGATTGRNTVANGLVLIVEATAWGYLLSLLVRRPLVAAVLACAATSLSIQIAVAITANQGRSYQTPDLVDAIPARLILCCIVLGATTVLARRWLLCPPKHHVGRRSSTAQRAITTTTSAHLPTLAASVAQQALQPLTPPTRRGMVLRLMWQTLRESWRPVLAVVGVGSLLMGAIELLLVSMDPTQDRAIGYLAISLLFLPALLGAMTFRSEQRHDQYRFLAEHAGRPGLVWLVRVGVWGAFLTLLLGAVALAAWWLWAWVVAPRLMPSPEVQIAAPDVVQFGLLLSDLWRYGVVNFTLAALATFAVGQLASLLLKSEILAGGVAVFVSMALLLFAYLVAAWRLPPMWCVAPVMVGALAASYIRLPDRLVDRNTWLRWGAVVLAVVVPVGAVLWSIPVIRSAQIDTALEQARALRAPDQSSLAEVTHEYRQAKSAGDVLAGEYKEIIYAIYDEHTSDVNLDAFGVQQNFTPPDVVKIVAAEPERIEQLVALTKHPGIVATLPNEAWVDHLVAFLAADFDRALRAGKLDTALERYLALQRFRGQTLLGGSMQPTSLSAADSRFEIVAGPELLVSWATAPGQSAERIKQAIVELQQVELGYPALAQLAGAAQAGVGASLPSSDLALILNTLPGEAHRSEVALEVFATLWLRYLQHVGELTGKPLRDQLQHYGPFGRSGPTLINLPPPTQAHWQRLWQTAESSQLASNVWRNSYYNLDLFVHEYFHLHTQIALERVRLTLIAFHLDQGKYPITLRELEPGYLAAVPIDVFSGEMFRYEPQGFEHPLEYETGPMAQREVRRIAAHTALVWSGGLDDAIPSPRNLTQPELSELINRSEYPEAESLAVMTFPGVRSVYDSPIVLPLPTDEEYPEE